MKVAPSILAADILHLGKEIRKMEAAGCDWIHIDVMDGSFVPNLSYGPHVAKAVRGGTELPLDVHLMIQQPEKYVDTFIAAGADWLTIHVESTKDPKTVLEKIKNQGIQAGITLKPNTPIEEVKPFLSLADLVLVMTVEPGFGGQAFQREMLKKVETLKDCGYKGKIEVDGGIDLDTGKLAVQSGAQVLVMGTALFCAERPEEIIREIHSW
ncbi:MAG: ribulose-phosphate 3-epimerase [Clostridiales bacterium]|nr:ribulose-phosphate 3-epimerase [Clostridiales bacterium]